MASSGDVADYLSSDHSLPSVLEAPQAGMREGTLRSPGKGEPG